MPGGAKAVIRETETDGIHLFPCLSSALSSPSHPAAGVKPRSRLGLGSTSLLTARERIFLHPSLHYERLSHSATHISLPTSRRNVCRDAGQIALSISDACSAPLLVLLHSRLSVLPFLPPLYLALSLLFVLHRCDLMELSAHSPANTCR